MPVGHRGRMSSHPAWVKIIILELIEERLKEAAEDYGLPREVVEVYDPFTTDNDFYLWLDVSWEEYLQVYSRYYNPELKSNAVSRVAERYKTKHSKEFIKARDYIHDDANEKKIFNASTSSSTIIYSIEDMKSILDTGTPLSREEKSV